MDEKAQLLAVLNLSADCSDTRSTRRSYTVGAVFECHTICKMHLYVQPACHCSTLLITYELAVCEQRAPAFICPKPLPPAHPTLFLNGKHRV